MSDSPTAVAQLSEMQVYIGREMIEEYRAGRINRRTLLGRLTLICGSAMGGAALLSSCGDNNNARMILAPDAAAPDAQPDGTAAGPDMAAAGDGRPGALSVPADDPAIQASKVQYDSTAATRVSAYLARPRASGSYPGVVVIHENRGLNDHIRDVARRLAKANFIALAPDLTSRGGTTDMLDPDMARAFLAMAVVDDLVADLSAGAEFLSREMGVTPIDRLGVVGFCFGGGYTYRLTAANPKIAAAASYYGPIQMDLIDQLRTVNAAILMHHAETDANVNATTDQLVMALRGKDYQLVIHPGTMHAFNNDTGASYNEAEAIIAWGQTIDWFNTHLRR
jgi:carboxymethylenebutenolidase